MNGPAKPTISTGICLDSKGEESLYTQMGANSSSPAFQAIYWKCACVLFASARRHDPDVRLVLITNATSLPVVAGEDIGALLGRMGVEVVTLAFTYAPPMDFYDRWRSTFYLFDIMRYFAETLSDDEQVIVNDADCLYIKPATDICRAIEQYHCLSYDVRCPADEIINGYSRTGLEPLYNELGQSTSGPVDHYGAEIFAANGAALRRIMPDLDALWGEMLERHRKGMRHFNTEEHFLSYLFTKVGYGRATANPYIERIWTGFKLNTASRSNFDLTTWHMPNEKKYGISRLYEHVRNPRSAFWTVEPGHEFARFVARFLAVPSPTASKLITDAIDRTVVRLTPLRTSQ